MKFLGKGVLVGLTFVVTYALSNLEPVNQIFQETGTFYHPARALVMFSIGYFLGILTRR